MERLCKTHGLHSNWRISQPPSAVRRGKGVRHICRYCRVENRKRWDKTRRQRDSYELILEHAGLAAAEEFKNTPNARVTTYVYRGHGYTLSQSMFDEVNSRQTKKRLVRVGKERIVAFLTAPTCEKCGRKHNNPSFFEVHHIIPREFGGGNEPENLIILCPNCHRDKHLLLENRKEDPFMFKK